MTEKEKGRTKEFPQVPGCYWVKYLRVDLRHVPPFLIEVDAHGVWNFGVEVSRDRYSFHDCEFLGPFTASDAEQLSELRKAGTRMLEVLETYKERHLVPSYFVNALADLRDTLGGIDRTVTVQCADCLAWFDKNSNHTCGKQVRANRRYSGGSHV